MSAPPCSYNIILNNVVQSSIEIAEESFAKASKNLISMCRSDDENNENYPENYKGDVKNSVPAAAVLIDGARQKLYGFSSFHKSREIC